MPEWLNGRRVALIVATLWILGVAIALMSTLQSLRESDFDGLNNALQFLFGLPWMLFPIPALTHNHNHVVDAWIDAGWGCLNAFLIYRWISHRQAVVASNELPQ
ncbi:MAG: hypothetical protein QOF59_2 [Actinomycetota bacterium]|jgi:hypothetical protein|nr:hypothetical protein [Actinomycetota bacterium]